MNTYTLSEVQFSFLVVFAVCGAVLLLVMLLDFLVTVIWTIRDRRRMRR